MKNLYVVITVVAVLFVNAIYSQDNSDVFAKKKKENIQLDTRFDNMGYWNKMIELGVTKGNAPIPFKPAEYKGSLIESNGLKAQDSPDVPVTNATNVTETENSVFVDPNDNQYVLNSNNSTSWNGTSVGSLYGANYFQTANGGSTWGGSVSGAGAANSGDPAAAINNSGRQFVGYISSSGGMGVSYSDNGTSWTAVTVYSTGSQDKNHLWVDNSTSSPYNGYLYNSWVDLNTSSGNYADNILSRSTNNGVSWSSVINISAGVNAGSHNQGVNIQTGPNGEVYAVWAIYDSWPSDETALGLAKSVNGGASFATATRIISNIKGIRNTGVPQNMRVNSFPSMAVDISGGPNNGNIYVVWTNIGTPGVNSGTAGVYMIRSVNGGTSWSTPVKVNQGSGTAYQPWIACDSETGALAVVFYDNRNTATADAEAWTAYSLDAGNTWTDMRVSDVSFTPTPIPGLATGYMGDYLGITAKGGRVYPCWTDNRGSTYMTYVSPFDLGLNAAYTANNTTVCTGSTVTYTDQSSGSPTSWTWAFPGGTPSSFSGQNPPAITYSSPGTYNVSLTVGDGITTDTETKTGYITVQNIIADFTGNPTTVVVGNTVTFTDNSSCNPTSWNWSFSGGNPATASGPGPHTITYNTLGTYNVSLTVSNASYNDTETKTGYIDVISCNYCTTSYSNTSDDYISNISFNTINNPSGSTNYSNFTSISTNVTKGNNYNISANITVNGNWVQHCWVWIDWNRDCDFDDSGEGFDLGQTPGTTGTHTLSASIPVPVGASLGSTRMRVSELYAGDPTPCTISTYGEAEDYTVVIQSSSTPPIADFSADDITPAVGQTVYFSDLSSGSPTSWSWVFNPATISYVGGTNSVSQNPQVQFNQSGYYTVTLTATNITGSDGETKTNYILAGTTGVWSGLTNTNWNLNTNWETFIVPTNSTDVTIPVSAPNWPTRSGDLILGTTCNNITMNGASELTVTGNLSIPAGKSFTCAANAVVHLAGNWSNLGTFNAGNGTVDFYNNTSTSINVPSGTAYLINDNINSWPGNWNGNVGGGAGNFGSSATVLAGGSSPEAKFTRNDVNLTTTRRMYYDPVNTAGLTSATLTFKHYVDWRNSPNYTLTAQYSTNGTTWTDIPGWSVTNPPSDFGEIVTLPLGSSQSIGAANYYISFTITGNIRTINAWYIDDVQLSYMSVGVENFYNLTISKSNNHAITNGNINVNNDMTVNAGAWFTNATGNTINVAGDVTLLGDNTGKGSFVDHGTLNVTGTTTVQSYYTDNRWHFISSPVSNAVSNVFLNIYLKEWDEATYTWNYIIPTNTPLVAGAGYEIWSTIGNPTINYTGGALNTGNISPALTATDVNGGGIGDGEGWNLVGNPYASAIDWGTANTPVPGYIRTNLDNAIYIWTGSQYATYNPLLNGGNGLGTNGGSQTIQSMQSFFVKANNLNPVLTIPNGARVHSAQANLKADGDVQMISLGVEGNGDSDEIHIEVNEFATEAFDKEYDAYKLWGNETSPQLYIITPGNDLSVHVVPEIEIEDLIYLGFKAGEENTYTITANQIENFDNYSVVLLEDLLTNTIVNLLDEPVYTFEASPEDDPQRFRLLFTDELIGLGDHYSQSVNIYSHANIIYVQVLSENTDQVLTVYDMLGQLMGRMDLVNNKTNAFQVNSGSGFYLAKVSSGNSVVTKKILLK